MEFDFSHLRDLNELARLTVPALAGQHERGLERYRMALILKAFSAFDYAGDYPSTTLAGVPKH